MAIPPIELTAAPATPYPHGLYAAAQVTQANDSRHLGGVNLDTPNAGAHGTWPVDHPTPAGTPEKGGNRPARALFPATIVWAADECSIVGVTEEEARDRALQTLRLSEQLDVEAHAAKQFEDVTPVVAHSIRQAVEVLEDALTARGHTGVIHARRGLIAHLGGLIVRQGSQLLTPGGHKWVFGAGYSSLGDTLVGTGPVQVRQSPVTIRGAVALPGVRISVAERVVTVGWEHEPVAVTLPRQADDALSPASDVLPAKIAP